MGKGIISGLYEASRMIGKAAVTLNDIKTVASGDPVKITKRIGRKTVNKTASKIAREVNKIFK